MRLVPFASGGSLPVPLAQKVDAETIRAGGGATVPVQVVYRTVRNAQALLDVT